MSTEKIIATFKEQIMRRFERDLDTMLGELESALRQQVVAEHTEVITNTTVVKRKKIAETEEAAMERGMTLEEIKIHNAEVDGWNNRGTNLRKKLLGIEDVATPVPAAEAVVEPGT